jgi:acyl-coenzyme A thioesterase PaaI-like protein
MSRDAAAPGERILGLWGSLARWPGGDRLFNFLLGRMVPYSGSVRPRVRHLEAGRCRAGMRERRRVRNHLSSVHATALATLGELVTGLATLTALPPGVRGILTALEVEYEKKARGHLVAECRSDPPRPEAGDGSVEHRAVGEIRDRDGDRVATVRATWRLSPPEA